MVMYDLVLVVVSINNENMATDTLPNRYVEAQTWPWHVRGEWSEK